MRPGKRIVSANGWLLVVVVLIINNAFGLQTLRLTARIFDLSLIRRKQEIVPRE